ncbi:MAG: ribosomal RNA small subunit methyltransferase A [Candidatus Muiribacteriaceae bacterium]
MKTIRDDIYDDLISNNIFLQKRFGQNYLKNPQILMQLKEISKDIQSDNIIEIGTGAGILTEMLCKTHPDKKIISYEIDSKIYNIVKKLENEHTNLSIIHSDFLKGFIEPSGAFSVFANIPYNISSRIIEKLLTREDLPENIFMLVQKEYASKLTSEDSTDYISCIANFFAKPEVMLEVSRNDFFPRPKVNSSFIKITPFRRKYHNLRKHTYFLKYMISQKKKIIGTVVRKKYNIQNIAFGKKRYTELSRDQIFELLVDFTETVTKKSL